MVEQEGGSVYDVSGVQCNRVSDDKDYNYVCQFEDYEGEGVSGELVGERVETHDAEMANASSEGFSASWAGNGRCMQVENHPEEMFVVCGPESNDFIREFIPRRGEQNY